MSANGTIYGPVTSWSSKYEYRIVYSQGSMNATNNTSVVTAYVQVRRISTNTAYQTSNAHDLSIAGTKYSDNRPIDLTGTINVWQTVVGANSKTISHDADGHASCTLLSGTWAGNGVLPYGSGYGPNSGYAGDTRALTSNVRAPAVSSSSATNIGANSATARGNVTDAGLPRANTRGVHWGTSSGSLPNWIASGSGAGAFNVNITGLARGTTYYFRAGAYNTSYGWRHGSTLSFTTTSAAPSVTTSAVSSIDKYSARFNGNVTSDQGAAITERGFVYSLTTSPVIGGAGVTKRTVSGTTGTYHYDQSSLSANTTYYVRAFATNSKGTSYGSTVSFKTLVAMPEVTSSAVTNLEATTATFNGNVVTDNGSAITERGVVYSLNSSPTTSDNKVTTSGTTGALSVNITGLSAATTYYYRAYAINAHGTSYGGNIQIKTLPGDPSGLSGTTISKSQINLTWTKGAGASTTIIRRATGSYPTTVTSGTGVYSGSGTSTNDTGLDAGTTYYYRAWSREGASNDSSGTSSFTGTTHHGLTNPGNLNDEDSTYATAPANDNKIYVQLSKNGGVNWHSEIVGELPSSNDTIILGEGSTELWGTTFTGPDMGDTNFRVKITLGSNKTSYQTLKDFGFNIVFPNLLTGIEVVPKGYFDTDTAYIDTVKVRCYYGTSILPITAGTQAYDTTTDRMVYFDGTNWRQIATTDDL